MSRKPTTYKTLRVIPQYREQIDVNKICRALILAAKEMHTAEASDPLDQLGNKHADDLELSVDISADQS